MKIREPKKKRLKPLTIEFETMDDVEFLYKAFGSYVVNKPIPKGLVDVMQHLALKYGTGKSTV